MKEKENKKDKPKKKKSKAGKVILFLLLIILILLAILYFGDGFGLGIGGGTGNSVGEMVQAIATVPDDKGDTIIPEEITGPVVIEVNQSAVKYGAEEFADYAAFEEYFYQNNSEGTEYILKDNQAIKSVYDSVKSLLDSFSCVYSEEVA